MTIKNLPSGPWIDEKTKKPLPIFMDLLADLTEDDKKPPVLSDDDKARLHEIEQSLGKYKYDAKKRVTERSFSSGPLTGSTQIINHGLNTEDIYYVLHKDGEGVVQSVEIVDANTIKVTANIPTSYKTIIVYTFK